MISRVKPRPFAAALLTAVAAFALSTQAHAISAPYTGNVNSATGTVGTLLGALPIPADGKVIFDGSNNYISANFNVGAFFFSSLWTGNCTVSPSDGTCMTTDPDLPIGSTFVPLLTVLSNTLTFDGSGTPNGGAISLDSFSVTFGLPLGDVTLDQGNGTFSLTGGILGEAFGTGSFQVIPVPAAAWLFGSALGLLGWIRRRATS